MDHLESNALLNPMQFGFRRHHSTDTACCHLIENIKSSLDTGGVVGAIFLDLGKAFDTVNHKSLYYKLAKLNVSTNSLNWFKTYLSDRTQSVRINHLTSETMQHRDTTGFKSRPWPLYSVHQ